MNEINCVSTNQLIEKARETIVPLPTQLRAQEELATLFSLHMNNIKAIENGVPADELPSLSSFIIGGTGSGKSHMTQNLAKVCGLNFERVDSSNLTSAGYRGRNVNHVILGILEKNPDWFDEGGVILFDEADKLRTVGYFAYDIYSPQKDFLCLLEKGDYTLLSEDKKTVTVNLDKTLILFAGACAQITPLLEKKYAKKKTLGFSTDVTDTQEEAIELLSKATLEDIKNYGFMPEIVGRLKQVIYIPTIDIEGYKILVNDSARTSAINKYKHIFETRGVKFKITNLARDIVAEKALEEGLGARSIEGVLNKIIVDAHNYVDRNPECNKVVLTVKDGEFKLNYYNGERIQKKVVSPEVPVITDADLDTSIAHDISSKLILHIFCHGICEDANLQNKYQEELLYCFLHTTCYFLHTQTRLSEQTYLNLVKLAKATQRNPDENPDSITPFEIICNDYLAKPHKGREKLELEDSFLPYYLQFKKLSCGMDASEILVKALHTAFAPYLKSKALNQETA